MLVILVVLTCMSLLLRKVFNKSLMTSRFLRDADLSFDGFIKAIGLMTIGVLSLNLIAYANTYHQEPLEVRLEHQVDDLDSSIYQDGIYIGSAQGFNGMVTVQVIVENNAMTSIEVLEHSDDPPWFDRAQTVIDDMIGSQGTDVDVVSGATYSSNGIINAVIDALD
ncbi:FMN-binding protein [Acidaminobacter sp. JC074]|uniref:FMN-binding protein n=1 Tax=Acidaminobacter sp. JC074 TaxID=2530199 RepID=UPI001F0E76B1|nr:FMN-binding protein [Acidaminobacter sp. JC074]MCH4889224.1 FMN-binding protein [Acidaminobacter sp. JC074]